MFVCMYVCVCRLYDGKVLCDFANELKDGAVSEQVRVNLSQNKIRFCIPRAHNYALLCIPIKHALLHQ